MTERLLFHSFCLAAGVLACGMVGCLVPIIGKAKRGLAIFLQLPSSTRFVLLLLAVGLTFVGATKTNRTNGVSSPLGTSSQVSRVGSTNPRWRDTDGDGYGDAGDHDLCATILWEMDRTEGAHV